MARAMAVALAMLAPWVAPASAQTAGAVAGSAPAPYREVAVGFDNRGARLAATLYLPRRRGRVPAMVLVHGSGTWDRAIYKRLAADHFARAGYAVLSYDKRGVGASTGKYEGDCNVCPDNIDLLASDASAALTFLLGRPEVRRDKTGFWGISQAGWIAPRAAVMNGHAAFLLLVSAPTTPVHQNLRYERLTNGRNPGNGTTPDQLQAQAAATIPTFPFADTDPAGDLQRLAVPALWMIGDRDWLVPSSPTIEIVQRFADQGKPYEYRLIHGADHGIAAQRQKEYWQTMDEWLTRILRD